MSRTLHRDLGVVRSRKGEESEHADAFRLIYLPAQRNPLDELAKREVRNLIELLRAQQQADTGSRNLEALRRRAPGCWKLSRSIHSSPRWSSGSTDTSRRCRRA